MSQTYLLPHYLLGILPIYIFRCPGYVCPMQGLLNWIEDVMSSPEIDVPFAHYPWPGETLNLEILHIFLTGRRPNYLLSPKEPTLYPLLSSHAILQDLTFSSLCTSQLVLCLIINYPHPQRWGSIPAKYLPSNCFHVSIYYPNICAKYLLSGINGTVEHIFSSPQLLTMPSNMANP